MNFLGFCDQILTFAAVMIKSTIHGGNKVTGVPRVFDIVK